MNVRTIAILIIMRVNSASRRGRNRGQMESIK